MKPCRRKLCFSAGKHIYSFLHLILSLSWSPRWFNSIFYSVIIIRIHEFISDHSSPPSHYTQHNNNLFISTFQTVVIIIMMKHFNLLVKQSLPPITNCYFTVHNTQFRDEERTPLYQMTISYRIYNVKFEGGELKHYKTGWGAGRERIFNTKTAG